MVEIFVKLIWPIISKDHRFKKLLKGKKTRIKDMIEAGLRNEKNKNPEIIIDLFWKAVYNIYKEDRNEPEMSPHISQEINNIIKKVFEQQT
ncbi:MAG: hypothetical protein P1P85_04320 [Patescibacteria group bacterium]|nr:hypothetical protein [Patescibacteria group bacterium]